MDEPIGPGDNCSITRDIVVDGKTAFMNGETVVVEKIEPNPSRPRYRYVVLSKRLMKRFQLSDQDVVPRREDEHATERWSVDSRTWILAGTAVLAVAAVAVVIYVLVTGAGKGQRPICWAVGEKGTVIYATNQGKNWFPMESETVRGFRGVAAPDENTAWVVGKKEGNHPLILKIEDGGFVPGEQTPDTEGRYGMMNGVTAVGPNTAWVAGFEKTGTGSFTQGGGTIMGTTDGGKTWEPQGPFSAVTLFSISAADESNAWSVGSEGTVFHTADGGRSWTAQEPGTGADLLGVWAADPENVFAVGFGGTICTTSNGGAGWTRRNSGTREHLYAACAVDAGVAWAVGTHGTILKTTDGWKTWKEQESGAEQTLRGVAALDADTAWAVGDSGTILLTEDGGATWKPQESGTESNLWDVSTIK